MSIANLLKDIYFLKAFSPDELHHIEKLCERVSFQPSQSIFQEKEAATAIFLIEVGTVKITKSGEETQIATLGKGSTFGEIPFFDGGDRSATATALEPTHLITIPYPKMRHLLETHRELGMKFYENAAKFMASRLRNTTDDLQRAKEFVARHF